MGMRKNGREGQCAGWMERETRHIKNAGKAIFPFEEKGNSLRQRQIKKDQKKKQMGERARKFRGEEK